MRAFLLTSVLALSIAGCVSISVPPERVINTNKEVERNGWKLSGAPTAAAKLEVPHRFSTRSIAAPFGKLHYVLADSDAGKPLIVFCGGNLFREQVNGAARAAALEPFGDMFIFDYPGYGLSEGAGTKSEFENARAPIVAEARRIAAKRKNSQVFFWGHSFGGTYCASLAASDKHASALVLEGSYGTVDAVVKGKAGILSPLVRADVDPETVNYDVPKLLADHEAPIVLVATHEDETVPFEVTKDLANELSKMGKKVRFIELSNSAHRTISIDPEYRAKVTSALHDLGLLH